MRSKNVGWVILCVGSFVLWFGASLTVCYAQTPNGTCKTDGGQDTSCGGCLTNITLPSGNVIGGVYVSCDYIFIPHCNTISPANKNCAEAEQVCCTLAAGATLYQSSSCTDVAGSLPRGGTIKREYATPTSDDC